MCTSCLVNQKQSSYDFTQEGKLSAIHSVQPLDSFQNLCRRYVLHALPTGYQWVEAYRSSNRMWDLSTNALAKYVYLKMSNTLNTVESRLKAIHISN